MEIKIRPAVSSDSAACGKLIAEALAATEKSQGNSSGFGESEASNLVARLLDHPEMYGLVAEAESHIAGTVFLDERAVVRGVGWLSVEPQLQRHGIGRLMMNEVIDRSLTSPGMRSVVDQKNAGAIELLSSLRFESKEPLALVRGRCKDSAVNRVETRAMTCDDFEACGELGETAHGFERASELRDAVEAGTGLIAAREGRITAYSTGLNSWPCGHAVAKSEDDLKALILASAAAGNDVTFLVPARQQSLLEWCRNQDLRIERSMLLMSLGEYQDPACAWLPSAMF